MQPQASQGLWGLPCPLSQPSLFSSIFLHRMYYICSFYVLQSSQSQELWEESLLCLVELVLASTRRGEQLLGSGRGVQIKKWLTAKFVNSVTQVDNNLTKGECATNCNGMIYFYKFRVGRSIFPKPIFNFFYDLIVIDLFLFSKPNFQFNIEINLFYIYMFRVPTQVLYTVLFQFFNL